MTLSQHICLRFDTAALEASSFFSSSSNLFTFRIYSCCSEHIAPLLDYTMKNEAAQLRFLRNVVPSSVFVLYKVSTCRKKANVIFLQHISFPSASSLLISDWASSVRTLDLWYSLLLMSTDANHWFAVKHLSDEAKNTLVYYKKRGFACSWRLVMLTANFRD